MQGRLPAGELAEYQSACGVEDGIPLDLFESDRPAVEVHADAATRSPAAGSGAGLNIGRILPYTSGNDPRRGRPRHCRRSLRPSAA